MIIIHGESTQADILCSLVDNKIIKIENDSIYLTLNGMSRYCVRLDRYKRPYDLIQGLLKELRQFHEEVDFQIADKQSLLNQALANLNLLNNGEKNNE